MLENFGIIYFIMEISNLNFKIAHISIIYNYISKNS